MRRRRAHALRLRYGRAVAKTFVGPFTIEVENTLLGSRQHHSASPYATLEEARDSAVGQAHRSRKFAIYNVLDRKGNVVESHRGIH